MSSSNLVFYVKLHLKPERVEEWKQAVTEVIELMSLEDAFVACYLHQDSQDPNLFTLYERWNEQSVVTLDYLSPMEFENQRKSG